MLAQFNSSPIDLLEEIACIALPQVIPSAVLMISPCATMKSSEAIEDGCKYCGVRNIQS
jgi:hypothetical protein